MNLVDYVGIPFKPKGRDRAGCDCWGLVRLFYAEQFSIQLPSFIDDYKGIKDVESIAKLMTVDNPLVPSVEHEQPEYGDLMLMKIGGRRTHIGVYIHGDRVLHVEAGKDAVAERLHNLLLRCKLAGYYRAI
jgi:cell wall-associated NlpC family hydrolase